MMTYKAMENPEVVGAMKKSSELCKRFGFKHDINYYNCNCCCFDCRRCNYFRKEKGRKKEQICGQ